MKVWMFNNYSTLPEHGQFTRTYNFGRYLKRMGHEPVVFAGSHPHNTDAQLIESGGKYRLYQEEPFPWMLVKTLKYGGNRKKQILTMFQYYLNGKKAAKHAAERYGRPDAILGSSAHPLAALLAVRLARKYGCRSVVEVRDLWPESLVAYGIAGPRSPAVIALRRLEKWLYTRADALVFTMGGAYGYIVERGWEKAVPREKVHFINNGVDLEVFQYNRDHFQVEDPDLDDPDTYKIVYTGSLGRINELDKLFRAIVLARDGPYKDCRFLIYGDGDRRPEWEAFCAEQGAENVRFKGRVGKEYIPYILSKCDMNILNVQGNPVLRYGGSQNKLFEYFAGGSPVLSGESGPYSVVALEGCGVARELSGPEDVLRAIGELREMGVPRERIRAAAEKYDFKVLTRRLAEVLAGEA